MITALSLLALLACDGKDDPTTDDTAASDDTASADTSGQVDADLDGYTPDEGDCADNDPSINPGVVEIECDGIDQNCDGVDLDDIDGDGYLCSTGEDCDDYDPAVNPGAADECGDGLDMNCDADPECDCDGDGFESALCGASGTDRDCDDTDDTVYPLADDTCYDGVDSDCNGINDYDCDGDSYESADYGGTDCDDNNYANYPGAEEICYDGVDNDCSAATDDCDCDGDGDGDPSCGGTDCDDSSDVIYPGATEAFADNLDNDCDDEIDEGAYCNEWAPLTNVTTGASKTYDVYYDGNTLIETVEPTSYDPKTGAATLARTWTGSLAYSFVEDWSCQPDEVALEGWSMSLSGIPFLALSFGTPRVDLRDTDAMLEGESWEYEYLADDPGFGTMWEVSGVIEVESVSAEILAGGVTYDALVLTNDYALVNSQGGFLDRAGLVRMYYVERLGLVYSEDVTDDGLLFESRELSGYSEFYP